MNPRSNDYPSKQIRIADLLDLHPGVAEVLLSFGLPCHDCVVAHTRTLEEGARLNGLDPEAILTRLRSLPVKKGSG